MKSLWNIVGFLSTVHLLAVLMLIGWMWHTKRLTSDRLHELKTMFATPAHGEDQQPSTGAAGEAEPSNTDDTTSSGAMDSAGVIAHTASIRTVEELTMRRLAAERATLLQQIHEASENAAKIVAESKRQQDARDQQQSAEMSRKYDEQFMRAVRQLEQLSPKQAKRILLELMEQNQHDVAVNYLVQMNSRAAAKVLKEFKTDEELKLATDLLERLRTFDADAARALTPSQSGVAGQASNAGFSHADANASVHPAARHIT